MSRTKARSRLARLAPRLVFSGVLAASVVTGVVVGCGIDYEGSLGHDEAGLDASENVGANLPEGSADGASDGPASDAGLDGDAAPPLSCSNSRCVDAGGLCDPSNNTCSFHCEGGTNCDAGVTCPPGVPCNVVCASDDSCAGKIDCTKATSCEISCRGAHTCEGVDCAGTSCSVTCSGMDSCQKGGINCEAGTCNIACDAGGGNNCKDPVTCESNVACSVLCAKDGCPGGVTAIAPDASIVCGAGACALGEKCQANYCFLGCNTGAGCSKLCCEAGICVVDGGLNTCL